MINIIADSIKEFSGIIESLPEEEYCRPLSSFDGATIGEHTRHIIELYQSLLNGYEKGYIDYDNRKRDKRIQNSKQVAITTLISLAVEVIRPNKNLEMNSGFTKPVETNYYRELLYNYEHSIHHQALIRIGLKELHSEELISENFGVAPSTIAYRNNVHS